MTKNTTDSAVGITAISAWLWSSLLNDPVQFYMIAGGVILLTIRLVLGFADLIAWLKGRRRAE